METEKITEGKKRFYHKHKSLLKDKDFLESLGLSILFLIVGLVSTFFAIIYATDSASRPVTDIILSNIPVFNLDWAFVYGPVVFWVMIAVYLLVFDPQKIPFSLKAISLFLVIRSVSISLTHIAPFPTHAQIDISGFFGVFTNGSDLFFSSHTGMPFLMALILWNNKIMKYFSIVASIFFGVVVLLTHLHYSIDVFAAFFITYSIYVLGKKWFKKDVLIGEIA